MKGKQSIKLKCPVCKKKAFSKSIKEDGSKFWYCYQCKYYKVTGKTDSAATAESVKQGEE